MIQPTFSYVDTAIGGVNKRNHVVDITQFKIPYGKVDCYRTFFRFEETYKKHCLEKGSVAGYKGKATADLLPLDIDDEDLSRAWEQTNTLILLLKHEYDYDVDHLFFSGAKGFHIFLPSQAFGVFEPSESLHLVFKSIVYELTNNVVKVDLKIYDQNRLLRISNTKNSKSGLFKIPLERHEFLKGIEWILEHAKQMHECKHPAMKDTLINNQFVELYNKFRYSQPESRTKAQILKNIKSGMEQGDRNDAAASIAGLLRSKGIDREICLNLLSGWNLKNTPPLPEEEIVTTVDSIYRYKTICKEDDIQPVWAAYDKYKTYISSEKKIDTGIHFIDNKIRGIRPGQVMTILGFTGNFKTGLLQWIMSNYCQKCGEPVLLFELEMSDLDLFERAAQLALQKSGYEVESLIKQDVTAEYIEQIKSHHADFYIVDKPGLSFNDLSNYIELAENKIHKEIGLIGVDFLQLMAGIGPTNVQKMDSIAKELKNFAKAVRKPVIALSQVTGVDDEFERISLMDVRDSKTIGQMSDYCLAIRQKKGTSDIQILDILKNRKGGKCSGELKIDRQTMRFREI